MGGKWNWELRTGGRLPSANVGELVISIAFCSYWYYFLGMITLTLRVPEELLAKLDEAARLDRTSRSELCRKALEARLKKTPMRRRSLLELSRDLCGVGSSGIRDLSTNKKHLEGFGQ
jgi:Arc/MetJ-type ribon-helix-helix transcriptional regulator